MGWLLLDLLQLLSDSSNLCVPFLSSFYVYKFVAYNKKNFWQSKKKCLTGVNIYETTKNAVEYWAHNAMI